MAQYSEHVVVLAHLLQKQILDKACPGNCGCNPMCGCDGKMPPCTCQDKCECECKGQPKPLAMEELVSNPVFARAVEHFDQTRIRTITDFEQLVREIQTALATP